MNLDELDTEVRTLRIMVIIALSLAVVISVKVNGIIWTAVWLVVFSLITTGLELLRIKSRRQ